MTKLTDPRKDYDAVIVGARCAGAATAMLLALRGLRVLAIDRGARGTDTLSTHALMRGAVAQLARWGLLDAVRAAGTPPVETATFHYGDEAVAVPIRPGAGFDALYAPRRTVLDRVLADAARDAGATLAFGCSLDALIGDGSGRVCGIRYRDRDGTPVTAHARIVIGADGVRSKVAEFAGAATPVQGKSASAMLLGYFGGLENRGYHFLYRPGLTGGVIPTNDGQSCVFVGFPAGTGGGPDAATRFRQGLSEIAPWLAEAVARCDPAGRLRFFGGVRGYLRQAHGPGWALVGDAGYFKDPATAHGITDAFRDAELLARAVAAGDERALEDYQHLRDALSLPLFGVTDSIASFDWTLDQLKPRLATLSEAMQTEVRVLQTVVSRTPLPAFRPRRQTGLAMAG